MKNSASSNTLRLPADTNYECVQCGRSCGQFLEISVDPEYVAYIRSLPAERLSAAQDASCPVVESPWTKGEQIMRLANGRCCLQQDNGLCAIHAAFGFEAKPPICRDFPFKFIQTPGGTFIGLSFACTAVLENAGPPVETQREALESDRISRFSRRSVKETLALTEDIPLTWEQYEAIEADLALMLAPGLGQIGERLVMQSVYLRLLINFLRQARERAGAMGAGPEANDEALAVLHRRMRGEGDGEGELFALVRRTAERRRTSPLLRRSVLGFAHALRTTYTQRLGRITSYWRSTRQYLLFAAGRGALDLPDAEAIPYATIARIGFDPTRAEFDELLTRYYRHRLFRKDLATAETVQTAHQMHLMHWGLIHWYAAAQAAQSGAAEIELEHLSESLRTVEKLFVFHSSFDKIFSHYPLLRGFMDRLFQNPLYAFAMGWGEWAERGGANQ